MVQFCLSIQVQPIQHLFALFLNLKWFEHRILESDFERGLDVCGMERLWERDCRCAVTSSWRDAQILKHLVLKHELCGYVPINLSCFVRDVVLSTSFIVSK